MSSGFQAICPNKTPCKCCGAAATLFSVVDFHKNCEIYRNNALDISGIPIYCHRCPVCRFIFTTALDHFSQEDFERLIYNDQYPLIDPDFAETRPRGNAALVSRLLTESRSARILDYGGGNGKLAGFLSEAGFLHVHTYDPFVPRFASRPEGRFDCVICFEMFEHSTDPAGTLADMIACLTDSGIILLSTLLQPTDIERQGLSWWYAAPRNAHVSLYSGTSLEKLVARFGFQLHSLSQSYHVLYRQNASLHGHSMAG
jgi:SAM-dependent methyltransferase